MAIVKYTKEFENLTKDFDCGNSVINNFLKSGLALDPNCGITYIMLPNSKDVLIGFYNIEVNRIDLVEDINGVSIYQPMGGSININYLCLDNDFKAIPVAESDGKKTYLGDILLHDCEKRILEIRQSVGASFITMNSTEEGYHLYHIRNYYDEFEDDMSMVMRESDITGYRFFKCIDDIV